MVLTRLLIIFSGLILFKSSAWAVDYNEHSRLPPISMIQLIANPEKFLNQVVTVSGWFGLYNLFATKEHYLMHDMSSAVDLMEPTENGEVTEACEARYVKVTGLFVLVEYTPTITNVSRVIDLQAQQYCWGEPLTK